MALEPGKNKDMAGNVTGRIKRIGHQWFYRGTDIAGHPVWNRAKSEEDALTKAAQQK